MLNFGLLGGSRRGRLPRTDLLIYLARPNSDAYITPEDSEIPEDLYDWGYVLPASLFSALGAGLFFESDGTPIVVLASEILADPATNNSNVLFKSISTEQQTGRLAIYDPGVSLAVLARAKEVLGIEDTGNTITLELFAGLGGCTLIEGLEYIYDGVTPIDAVLTVTGSNPAYDIASVTYDVNGGGLTGALTYSDVLGRWLLTPGLSLPGGPPGVQHTLQFHAEDNKSGTPNAGSSDIFLINMP